MILDVIGRLAHYESMHRLFPAAAAFLQRVDLADLPCGRHELGGNEIYALVIKEVGKPPEKALLEIHNAYIDIQVVLHGTDSIGWKPRSGCARKVAGYDPDRDLQFFYDTPDTRVHVHAGQFAAFFPEDAHAPMVSASLIHKVVIKVAV